MAYECPSSIISHVPGRSRVGARRRADSLPSDARNLLQFYLPMHLRTRLHFKPFVYLSFSGIGASTADRGVFCDGQIIIVGYCDRFHLVQSWVQTRKSKGSTNRSTDHRRLFVRSGLFLSRPSFLSSFLPSRVLRPGDNRIYGRSNANNMQRTD